MPSEQQYSNRRDAYRAWLTANDIDPGHVPLDADVYLDTDPDGARHIVYEVFHLDSEGRKQVNERGDGAATERRTTPLLVDPPDWWQPYRKPTRDQLLNVLQDVKQLADEQGEMNDYIERARLRAVLALAFDREGLESS